MIASYNESKFPWNFIPEESKYGTVSGKFGYYHKDKDVITGIEIGVKSLPNYFLKRARLSSSKNDHRRMRPVNISNDLFTVNLRKKDFLNEIRDGSNRQYTSDILLVCLDKSTINGEYSVSSLGGQIIEILHTKQHTLAIVNFKSITDSVSFHYIDKFDGLRKMKTFNPVVNELGRHIDIKIELDINYGLDKDVLKNISPYFIKELTGVSGHTSNPSFVELVYHLKNTGVRNLEPLFKLVNKKLENVDPFSKILTENQKTDIIVECVVNPYYFFRECLREKKDGKMVPFTIDSRMAASIQLLLIAEDENNTKTHQILWEGEPNDCVALLWSHCFKVNAPSTERFDFIRTFVEGIPQYIKDIKLPPADDIASDTFKLIDIVGEQWHYDIWTNVMFDESIIIPKGIIIQKQSYDDTDYIKELRSIVSGIKRPAPVITSDRFKKFVPYLITELILVSHSMDIPARVLANPAHKIQRYNDMNDFSNIVDMAISDGTTALTIAIGEGSTNTLQTSEINLAKSKMNYVNTLTPSGVVTRVGSHLNNIKHEFTLPVKQGAASK